MSLNFKALLTKLFFWLALEIFLNLVGLDNLADYSEFISNQTAGRFQNSLFNHNISLVTPYPA